MDLTAVVRSAVTALIRRPAVWAVGAIAIVAGQGAGPISWLSVEWRALPVLQAALVNFLRNINVTVVLAVALGLLALGVVQSAAGALLQGTLVALVAPPPGARPGLREAVRTAVRRFRPLFLVRLLIGVSVLAPALLVLAALVAFVAFAAAGAGVSQDVRLALVFMALCLVPLFMLIALSALVLGWIEMIALRACVLDGAAALAAMRCGWRLLRVRPLAIGGLWLTAFGLGLAGGFVTGTAAAALAAPAVTMLVLGEPLAAQAAVSFALAYLLVLAAGGALTALQSAIWTRGYPELGVR